MPSSILRFVREDVRGAKYHGVETLQAIAQETGVPVDQLVKLNANENSYGCPKEVLDSIQEAAHHIYPDPGQVALRSALAKLHNVKSDQIVAGAGSDDILDILMRLIGPDAIVISTPTFGMYSFLGKLAGTKVVNVDRKEDFQIDVQKVAQAIKKHKAKIAFLPSPNNPTGTPLTIEQMKILLKEDCILVVDEAYAEFCDVSAFSILAEHDNLVVTRTFSKWAGLAGLRLGYAVAHEDLVAVMLTIKQPYNVNTAAEAAGLAAIKHREAIMKTVSALVSERDRLFGALEQLPWLRPIPSQANFVLCEVLGREATAVYQALRKRGIIIRYFGAQGGNLHNYIRISSGRPEDITRVISALQEVQEEVPQMPFPDTILSALPECVLFDMDGVLADVTHSQHKAIILTAKSYGLDITEDDITRIKALGNANNDWQITRALVIEAKLGNPTLEEVTERFENIYQGTDENPGLWEVETLLVDRSLMSRIAKHFTVGVVTGRPRADAERFLDQHSIREYVQQMVCMGEAPAKPDPAPVKLALERLKVQTAVFIGDTPDDMRAGCAAGVPSLGVVAPSVEDKEKDAENLRACGATTVLRCGLPELQMMIFAKNGQ
eukprot:m.165543 g.165543  ORF g.165543 m.165543 type:complete len:607 (-) comp24977_c0_seq13:158-1978(-)